MTEIKKEEKEEVKGEAGYCVCNKPATASNTMINCGECKNWFHIKCVLPQDSDAALITKYICEQCQQKSGHQTKWKGKKKRKQEDNNNITTNNDDNNNHINNNKDDNNNEEDHSPKKARENPLPAVEKEKKPSREPVRRSARNKVKHNYSELNDGNEDEIGDKSIVIDYVKMLKKANCTKSDTVPHKMKGEDLTLSYLQESGFREPLLVDNMEALDMKMPPSTITVNRIKELVGATRPLDVMEVSTQAEVDPKWTMEQWAEYYHTPIEKRDRILNVISLEISKTPLNAQIQSPRIVREIDWIDKVWPQRWKAALKYPQVQVYCLMSVQNAYTDFHIDFGGSSVWYHVIKGKKIFYLVPPEKENLEKYATWSSSPRQSKVWFGNLVPKCYEAHVNPGQTFFIPTGWIHAVFTPEDSLVFGGNFLHGFNSRLQLDIYDVETTTHVPEKFRFPMFRQIVWFAANKFVEAMKKEGPASLCKWERDSAKAVLVALEAWFKDPLRGQKDVPTKIKHPDMLLQDMHRFLDNEIIDEPKVKEESPSDSVVKDGADSVEIKQEVPKKKRGPKKKNLNNKSNNSTPAQSPDASPASTPSSSPHSSISPAPSASLKSSSPSSSTSSSSHYSHNYFRDERSSVPNPSSSPPTSPYPYKNYMGPTFNSQHYPAPPPHPNMANPYSKSSSSFYPPPPPSSYYKLYSPPVPPPRPSPSHSPSTYANSHSSFADLLNLTHAAESLEKESYSRYSNYEPHAYDNYRKYPSPYETGSTHYPVVGYGHPTMHSPMYHGGSLPNYNNHHSSSYYHSPPPPPPPQPQNNNPPITFVNTSISQFRNASSSSSTSSSSSSSSSSNSATISPSLSSTQNGHNHENGFKNENGVSRPKTSLSFILD